MGFPEGDSREIIAGDTLIAEAIQSQNYVAGTTGWAIKADGTVDLAGGTFRGSVIVTSPDGSLVQIVPGNGGKVEFGPKTVAGVTVNANASEAASISAFGGAHYGFLTLNAPQIADSAGSGSASSVGLFTKITDGSAFPGWSATPAGLFEIGPDCQMDRSVQVAGSVQTGSAPAGTVGYQTETVFTSSGTWTAPTGVKFVRVKAIGGGGGGGGTVATGATTSAVGGGGQGGGYAESLLTAAAAGTPVTVTVGGAGTAGAGAAGGAGGQSSFGALVIAAGGAGGPAGAASASTGITVGGNTAQTLTGQITAGGQPGAPGIRSGTGGNQMVGGNGGGSHLGAGGFAASGAAGAAGNGYGSGGAGASAGVSAAAAAGGAGTAGAVIVTSYF